jgi:hypothetical protein
LEQFVPRAILPAILKTGIFSSSNRLKSSEKGKFHAQTSEHVFGRTFPAWEELPISLCFVVFSGNLNAGWKSAEIAGRLCPHVTARNAKSAVSVPQDKFSQPESPAYSKKLHTKFWLNPVVQYVWGVAQHQMPNGVKGTKFDLLARTEFSYPPFDRGSGMAQ